MKLSELLSAMLGEIAWSALPPVTVRGYRIEHALSDAVQMARVLEQLAKPATAALRIEREP